MNKTKEAIKPEELVKIAIEVIIRRRWFIIIPFCISMVIGIYLALILPKIYRASTLILLQPQKVPAGYVRPIISTSIESRIRTISQQIMSRTNIEKIVKAFQLLSGPQYENMFAEDKIANVRNRISVRAERSTSFSISFQGKDPEKVTKVANALANYFIDENLKVREAEALGTNIFLEDELNTMRKRLEKKEEDLREVRKKYMGGLPEQLGSNLSILESLQKQLVGKQDRLREAKNRLISHANPEFGLQDLQDNFFMFAEEGAQEAKPDEDSATLQRLREELALLKGKYTDRHPDIVRLKRAIENYEAQIEKQADTKVEELQPAAIEIESLQPEVKFQDLQRQQQERQISDLQDEISRILEQIKIYQTRIEETPKREEEILALKRDYGNLKSMYSSLLQRRLEADISLNMEKKQKGEQFQILDPARRPTKPISPNLKRLFMLTLAAGLAVGGGLIFLLEFLHASFRRLEDMESVLGIPVIATVPTIFHPKDIKRQKINTVFSFFSIIFSLILFAGFAALTLTDVDQSMTFLNKFGLQGIINSVK